MIHLKQLLRRKHPNCIELDHATVQDLIALSEESGLPLETVCDHILQEHLRECLKNREARKRFGALSQRVRQVAMLYCQGFNQDQIASQLNISPETVKAHLRMAVIFLGLHGRAELREALQEMVEEADQPEAYGNLSPKQCP